MESILTSVAGPAFSFFPTGITFLKEHMVLWRRQICIWPFTLVIMRRAHLKPNQQVDFGRLVQSFIATSAAVPQGKPEKA